MIEGARRFHGQVAAFKPGNADALADLGTFSLITSLMTLQFIEDVQGTLAQLAAVLAPGGVLVASVFNRDYVYNAAQAGLEFFGFDFADNPAAGYMELTENHRIATYLRDAAYYVRIMEDCGLRPVLEAYPPFTKDFLRRYPHPVPTNDPEYMILGFKK